MTTEHTNDFTAAQDKANRAYDEALRKTGRGSDASNAYKLAMSEYYNHIEIKPRKRVVMTSVNTAAKQITTVDPDWAAFCKRVDETDCTSQWEDRGQDH